MCGRGRGGGSRRGLHAQCRWLQQSQAALLGSRSSREVALGGQDSTTNTWLWDHQLGLCWCPRGTAQANNPHGSLWAPGTAPWFHTQEETSSQHSLSSPFPRPCLTLRSGCPVPPGTEPRADASPGVGTLLAGRVTSGPRAGTSRSIPRGARLQPPMPHTCNIPLPGTRFWGQWQSTAACRDSPGLLIAGNTTAHLGCTTCPEWQLQSWLSCPRTCQDGWWLASLRSWARPMACQLPGQEAKHSLSGSSPGLCLHSTAQQQAGAGASNRAAELGQAEAGATHLARMLVRLAWEKFSSCKESWVRKATARWK